MKITILTLFPEMVRPFFEESIMARAVQAGLVEYSIINFREFASDKHHKCDDAPFGGGAGMVLKPEPLFAALNSIKAKGKRVVYATPSGHLFNQRMASLLKDEEELIFICGHYEGMDQRVIDEFVTDEISIGDYVLSSGEVATLAIIDTIYRLIPGVITPQSLDEESFNTPLLEYPQWTRPAEYCGKSVPSILLSGNHKEIREWRENEAKQKTLSFRPDLINNSGEDHGLD